MREDLQELFSHSVGKDISDVHLHEGQPPILRINGELTVSTLKPMTEKDIRAYIEHVASKEQVEKVEKTGTVDLSYIEDRGHFRVNIFREVKGLAVVVRVIPMKIPSLEDMGLPQVLADLSMKPNGLVLLTGPTGSGKSTTLAAMIDHINHYRKAHIITIEDPIEFFHTNQLSIITQREVGKHTDSFAQALRSALREDPDVIMVGEMRDLETISNAITAAETGHLVFGTLHSNDVVQAIDRMIDVFPPYQQSQIRTQLSAVLQGVIYQVLARKNEQQGRMAAFEVMLGNLAIRNLIRENTTHLIYNTIQTSAGMQLLNDSLKELYLNGIINFEEALRLSHHPQQLEKALSRSQKSSFKLMPPKFS